MEDKQNYITKFKLFHTNQICNFDLYLVINQEVDYLLFNNLKASVYN